MLEIPAKNQPESGTIIVLHGWGANAYDLIPVAQTLEMDNFRYIFPEGQFEVPGTGGQGKGWFTFPINEMSEAERLSSRKQIFQVLNDLVVNGTPLTNIVLMGFSQGAGMCFDVALHYPRQESSERRSVGGVIGLSGFLMDSESIQHQDDLPTDIPIFAAHGTEDPILPFNEARRSVLTLREVGFDVEWHEYPMGHQIVMDEIQDIKIFLQKRFPS